MIKKTIDAVSDVTGKIAAWSAVFMMLLIFASVMGRYLFSKPILFADEVSGYLLVFHCFIGAAFGVKAGRYIRVDEIFVKRMRTRVQAWLELITWIISVFPVAIFLWHSIIWTIEAYESNYTAGTILLTPMWIPYLMVPVGLSILLPQMLVQIYKAIKTLQNFTPADNVAEVNHD